jgi:hypothetical protein
VNISSACSIQTHEFRPPEHHHPVNPASETETRPYSLKQLS